jgi:hypothetical protein
MKFRKFILIFVCLATMSGCKDMLFGIFGDAYSDGYTRDEKYARYNAQVEQSQKAANR